MQARGAQSSQHESRGRTRRAWAWALGVSLAAHVGVLLGLLVIRLPALQLPVTPSAGAAPRATLFKVGVLAHAGPLAADGVPTAAPATSAPAGVPVRAAPATATAAAALAVADAAEVAASPVEESSATPSGRAPETTSIGGEAVAAAASGGAATGDAVAGAGVAGAGVAGAGVAGAGVAGAGVAGAGVAGAGVAVAGVAGAGAAGGVDVVGLVHGRLAANAERCYPAAARRFQQRGTVEVRFCVDAQGAVQDALVQRSSGAGVLDAAVAACVLPAAAPFPELARGRCFTVPVRFGLR